MEKGTKRRGMKCDRKRERGQQGKDREGVGETIREELWKRRKQGK